MHHLTYETLESSGKKTGHIKVDENVEKIEFSEKRQNSDSSQLFLDWLGILV